MYQLIAEFYSNLIFTDIFLFWFIHHKDRRISFHLYRQTNGHSATFITSRIKDKAYADLDP